MSDTDIDAIKNGAPQADRIGDPGEDVRLLDLATDVFSNGAQQLLALYERIEQGKDSCPNRRSAYVLARITAKAMARALGRMAWVAGMSINDDLDESLWAGFDEAEKAAAEGDFDNLRLVPGGSATGGGIAAFALGKIAEQLHPGTGQIEPLPVKRL